MRERVFVIFGWKINLSRESIWWMAHILVQARHAITEPTIVVGDDSVKVTHESIYIPTTGMVFSS